MKEEKAITLVSLVVTIIVLMLLVGVSINFVIGDNGIIKTAQQSKQNVQDMITDKQTKLNEIYTQEEERQENTAAEEIIKLKEFKSRIADAINNLTQSKTNLDLYSETEEFEGTIENMLYTLTEDADAQASDIAEGKTAYVDGKLVTGTSSNLENVEEFELLWTSTEDIGTTGSEFSIDLDLSKYKYIVVEFIYGTYTHVSYQIAFEKDVEYRAQTYHDNSNGNVHYRTYYWNDTGVHFVKYSNKSRCNPIRIYGL